MLSQDVEAELRALFDYNPPPVKLSTRYELTFAYPNLFYNRHLDAQYSLKYVKLVPSLADEIARVAQEELGKLDQPLPPVPISGDSSFTTKRERKALALHSTMYDATSVARFYSQSSVDFCHPVASTITSRTPASSWLSILSLDEGDDPDLGEHPAMSDTFVLQIKNDPITRQLEIDDDTWSCIDDQLRSEIRTIYDRSQTLAMLQFHAPLATTKDLFQEMGNKVKRGKFVPLPVGIDAGSDCIPRRPDSSSINSLPSVYALCTSKITRRSARLNNIKAASSLKKGRAQRLGNRVASTWPTITVKAQRPAKQDAVSFLQWGWMRSAKFDATFLVFNCGSYERIGIRHRGSQTLFLSDLINVSQGSNPGYGQVQVGLYTILLRDVLERMCQHKSSQPPLTVTKRQRFDDAEEAGPSAKKRKTRSGALAEAADQMLTESAKTIVPRETDHRVLALLRMQYGPFNSPAPMALYRIEDNPSMGNKPKISKNQRTYTPHDYFRVTLTSEVWQGSTGRVHNAIIEVQVKDGQIHACEAIAKIALYPQEQKRLRHEYAVYRHMRLKGVKCIATVYGFFQDVTKEAMILVMSHAGICLAEQPSYKQSGQVTLTTEECNKFKAAMAEIHEAGVRHYDIRPANLLLYGGKATIIDFDQAKIGAGKHSREREFDHLCDLLDGGYVPPNTVESPPTSVGSTAINENIPSPHLIP